MSNVRIHVISDLHLGFNEFSTEEETIPDVDLVIINGNLGHIKRGMLYTETLCHKFPNVQFVYNPGETELYTEQNYQKTPNEVIENMSIRKNAYAKWPKNLHYSIDPMIVTLSNGITIDFFCLYGYPFIHKVYGSWEDTTWHKWYVSDSVTSDDITQLSIKPRETSNVNHGQIAIPADLNYINHCHNEELTRVRQWELTNNNCSKILVTHINPYKDSRLINQEFECYNIHIHNALWIGSDTEINGTNFYGGKLYANPGRGPERRNKVILYQS